MTITVETFCEEIRKALALRGITHDIHMGEFDSLTVGLVTQNGKMYVKVFERETTKAIHVRGTVAA